MAITWQLLPIPVARLEILETAQSNSQAITIMPSVSQHSPGQDEPMDSTELDEDSEPETGTPPPKNICGQSHPHFL